MAGNGKCDRADRVQHVQDAVAKGAKVLVGGKRGKRTEYMPTILTDVTDECVRPSVPIHPNFS